MSVCVSVRESVCVSVSECVCVSMCECECVCVNHSVMSNSVTPWTVAG